MEQFLIIVIIAGISYVTLFCAVGFIKETAKFVSALKGNKRIKRNHEE